MIHIPDNIIFNGGAFAGAVEHFGNINALIDSNIVTKETIFYGISAGAQFALIIFLYSNRYIKKRHLTRLLKCFVISMGTCKLTNTTELLFENINNFKKHCYRDLYLDVCNKVIIGVTTRNGFKWVSKYRSNYHFFKTLLYSCNLSCMSTFSHNYLDALYTYKPFNDLSPKTLILHTTYYPPICLIPFTDDRIVTYLYNNGYLRGSCEIQRYKKDGMEQLIDSQNTDYRLLFFLHEICSSINPKWKRQLKKWFKYNSGR